MPDVRLSDRTYRRLVERIERFGDTAEDVIARLLDATDPKPRPLGEDGPAGKGGRATPGTILPEREYWLPILAILAEAGGAMPANDVIDALEGRIGDRLKERDLELLELGEVRWRNRARFARLRMKERGLLDKESPRGVWEITEQGREYLGAQ